MKLTPRQQSNLQQLAKGYKSSMSRDVAKQLAAKGLVEISGTHDKYEWGRKIATLTDVELTPAGKAMAIASFLEAIPHGDTRDVLGILFTRSEADEADGYFTGGDHFAMSTAEAVAFVLESSRKPSEVK